MPVLLFTLFMFVVDLAFSGWVLTFLWKWFVVPVITSPTALSVPHAMGLLLIPAMLLSGVYVRIVKPRVPEDIEDVIGDAIQSLVPVVTIFAMGAVLCLFH